MGQIITVDFRSDTIFAVSRDDGVFVAVTPICVALGLDAKRQRDRIQRDPILSEGGTMMALPSVGGMQDTFCLRLDLVHGWLFTIDESRVRDEETRQKVLVYKRECYRVLFEHFHGERTGSTAEVLTPPHAEQRPFPDWTLEELRTKGQTVDRYRITLGLPSAQWIMPQLGFPMPPPELVHRTRQLEIFSQEFGGDSPDLDAA